MLQLSCIASIIGPLDTDAPVIDTNTTIIGLVTSIEPTSLVWSNAARTNPAFLITLRIYPTSHIYLDDSITPVLFKDRTAGLLVTRGTTSVTTVMPGETMLCTEPELLRTFSHTALKNIQDVLYCYSDEQKFARQAHLLPHHQYTMLLELLAVMKMPEKP